MKVDPTDTNPFRYCGEYYDAETGSYYLRARYYDSALGRFTQQDTYRGDNKIPLSLNYYIYCYNNPIRYVDSSGNIPVDTVLDVASLGWSFAEFVAAPGVGTFGALAWDAFAVVAPYVPGSYVTKMVNAGTKVLSKVDNYVKSGVWTMHHFERGYEIERALGGWANNFPTIDFAKICAKGDQMFLDDIVSIKSLNITASTYQNPKNLEYRLKKYIDQLAEFESVPKWNGSEWIVNPGTSRTLKVAVPPVEMSSGQADAFQHVIDEYINKTYKNKNITMEIVIVK